jgi:hypoxanthine-guanine phosphoribosyltransferase
MNAHLAALDPDGLIAEVLVDEEALQARIAELGAAVTRDYAEADVLLVGVL